MNNLEYLLNPKMVALYYENNPLLEEPYLGEAKFPNKKQIGLNLSYIKGSQGIPVRLSASNYDVDVIKLKRRGFEGLNMKIPFFKNAYTVDEELFLKLLEIQNNSNEAVRNVVLDNVYNDEAQLIKNARVTMEMLRMEALTTGAIAINDNGVSKEYDFGIPSDQKITISTEADKWSASATAKPLEDMQEWIDLMATKGVTIKEFLMNGTTFNLIRNASTVKSNWVVNTNAPKTATISKSAIKSFVEQETNTVIYVYDKGYQDADGEFIKFVPDNVVVAMPENILGNTYFGTTPEEGMLMYSNAVDSVAIVETGVALTNDKNADPVWSRLKVSMACLPSFEGANQVLIATVA